MARCAAECELASRALGMNKTWQGHHACTPHGMMRCPVDARTTVRPAKETATALSTLIAYRKSQCMRCCRKHDTRAALEKEACMHFNKALATTTTQHTRFIESLRPAQLDTAVSRPVTSHSSLVTLDRRAAYNAG